MNECDLYGCVYNDDGECCYDNSDIKVFSQTACNDKYYDNDIEE